MDGGNLTSEIIIKDGIIDLDSVSVDKEEYDFIGWFDKDGNKLTGNVTESVFNDLTAFWEIHTDGKTPLSNKNDEFVLINEGVIYLLSALGIAIFALVVGINIARTKKKEDSDNYVV